MAADAPALEPAGEVLAREAEHRPRAALAAFVAGIATLGGAAALGAVLSDQPRVYLIEALRDVTGASIGREGLLTEQLRYFDDKGGELIASGLIQALGALGIGVVLSYLYAATKARRPETSNALRITAMLGPVLAAIGYAGQWIAVALLSHDFVTGDRFDTATAHDALRSTPLYAAGLMQFLGEFIMAVSFALIALNAMRVGLLTRFMGILGIFVGLLFIIRIGSQLPIVHAFWLVATGLLILGRWPNGLPPAWTTGRAEPWPTQQELREARDRDRDAAPEAAAGDPSDPRAAAPSPATSKKKKRKRRG